MTLRIRIPEFSREHDKAQMGCTHLRFLLPLAPKQFRNRILRCLKVDEIPGKLSFAPAGATGVAMYMFLGSSRNPWDRRDRFVMKLLIARREAILQIVLCNDHCIECYIE